MIKMVDPLSQMTIVQLLDELKNSTIEEAKEDEHNWIEYSTERIKQEIYKRFKPIQDEEDRQWYINQAD